MTRLLSSLTVIINLLLSATSSCCLRRCDFLAPFLTSDSFDTYLIEKLVKLHKHLVHLGVQCVLLCTFIEQFCHTSFLRNSRAMNSST
jgi:hypothetical protein